MTRFVVHWEMKLVCSDENVADDVLCLKTRTYFSAQLHEAAKTPVLIFVLELFTTSTPPSIRAGA